MTHSSPIDFVAWERAIIAAEVYWFSLPRADRDRYTGQTVAVTAGRILDTDADRAALGKRLSARYPDLPILYVEADEQQFASLIVRGPRLD